MPSAKKKCLKEIVRNFLTEFDKLAYVGRTTTNRNFDGSFFLSNSDVTRIMARKSVLDELFLPVAEGIFGKKVDNKNRGRGHVMLFCNDTKTKGKIELLNKKIDEMSEEKAEEVLKGFLEKTAPIVNAKAVERGTQDRAEMMMGNKDKGITAYDQKKSALMEHSFNDKWIFNFLAKLVKTVQEALGIKTSSEKLLEESREAASEVTKSP